MTLEKKIYKKQLLEYYNKQFVENFLIISFNTLYYKTRIEELKIIKIKKEVIKYSETVKIKNIDTPNDVKTKTSVAVVNSGKEKYNFLKENKEYFTND